MTTDLQPGHELDKAIALRLGWKEITDPHELSFTACRWIDPSGLRRVEKLPLISTDTATAMATLEQLRKEKGWLWEIHSPGSCSTFWVGIHCDFDGYSDTLAHAAALAMKAVLEAEK